LKVAVGVPKENTIKGIVFGELSDIYIGSVAQLLSYLNILVKELYSEVGREEPILITAIVNEVGRRDGPLESRRGKVGYKEAFYVEYLGGVVALRTPVEENVAAINRKVD